LASLVHHSKFQRVSRLGFVESWAGTLNIFFSGSCPLTQNSLCVQVLRSPILAALLLGTRAVGVIQTAAFSRRRHLYSAGRPSRWASAHILCLTVRLSACRRLVLVAFIPAVLKSGQSTLVNHSLLLLKGNISQLAFDDHYTCTHCRRARCDGI